MSRVYGDFTSTYLGGESLLVDRFRENSIANKYQRKRTIENATTRKCPVDQLLDYSK